MALCWSTLKTNWCLYDGCTKHHETKKTRSNKKKQNIRYFRKVMDWATLWNPLCGLDPWTLDYAQAQSAAATRAHLNYIWIVILVCLVLACWYWYCHSSYYSRFSSVQPPMFTERKATNCLLAVAGCWFLYVAYQIWKAGRMWQVYRLQMDTLLKLGLESRDVLLYMQQNHTSQIQAASRIAAAQMISQASNSNHHHHQNPSITSTSPTQSQVQNW